MRRRAYLAALAATIGVAGCTSNDEPTDSAPTSPGTTRGATNTTQNTDRRSPNVVVEDVSVLPAGDLDGYSTPLAELRITNTGDAATRRFFITINWFDETGELLGSSGDARVRMRTLGAGETWLPRIKPYLDVDEPSAVASAEVDVGEVDTAFVGSEGVRPDESNSPVAELDPDGISVSGKTLDTSDGQVSIRGSVTNNRQSAVGYLETVAKAHNAEGAIIGWDYTDDRDVAAGETVYYDMDVDTVGRADEVETASISIGLDRLDY